MIDMNYLTNVGNIRVMQTDSDFDAKPQVMLLGQYSTGKTTFIKHLLRTSYPGAHIGPEPTTDRFVVVMVGASSPQERAFFLIICMERILFNYFRSQQSLVPYMIISAPVRNINLLLLYEMSTIPHQLFAQSCRGLLCTFF